MQIIFLLILALALGWIGGYIIEDLRIQPKEDRETMKKISKDLEEIKNKKNPDE